MDVYTCLVPIFFNVCMGGPSAWYQKSCAIRHRMKSGQRVKVGGQKVSDFQSTAIHNGCKLRLYSI